MIQVSVVVSLVIRMTSTERCKLPVVARFVTTARFVSKVTKRAAKPARFFTNEVVTNRADIAPFFSLGYQFM